MSYLIAAGTGNPETPITIQNYFIDYPIVIAFNQNNIVSHSLNFLSNLSIRKIITVIKSGRG